MDASRRRSPLDCSRAEAEFAGRLDGTLAGDRRLALDGHLAACPACAAAWADYAVELAREACRAEEAEPIPEDLAAAILAARRGQV